MLCTPSLLLGQRAEATVPCPPLGVTVSNAYRIDISELELFSVRILRDSECLSPPTFRDSNCLVFDPARLEISVPANRTAMIDWILAAIVANGSIDHQAAPTEGSRLASMAHTTKMAEIENLVLADLRREQEINPIERGVAWQRSEDITRLDGDSLRSNSCNG